MPLVETTSDEGGAYPEYLGQCQGEHNSYSCGCRRRAIRRARLLVPQLPLEMPSL